jgi:hypothetical protein
MSSGKRMKESPDFFKKFMTNLISVGKSSNSFKKFNEEKKIITEWFAELNLECTVNYDDFEYIILKYLIAYEKTLYSSLRGGALFDENGNPLPEVSSGKCSIKTNIIKLVLILLFITSLIYNVSQEKNSEYHELAVLNNLENQPDYITRIEMTDLKDSEEYLQKTIALSKNYMKDLINEETPLIAMSCKKKFSVGRDIEPSQSLLSRVMSNLIKASVPDNRAISKCNIEESNQYEKALIKKIKDIIEIREIEMRKAWKKIKKDEEVIYNSEFGMAASLAGLLTIYGLSKLNSVSKHTAIEKLNENMRMIEPIVWEHVTEISPEPDNIPSAASHSKIISQMRARIMLRSSPEPPPTRYRSRSRSRSPPRSRSSIRARTSLNRSPSPMPSEWRTAPPGSALPGRSSTRSAFPRKGGKTRKCIRKSHKRKTHRR